jgi:hypothetical protein
MELDGSEHCSMERYPLTKHCIGVDLEVACLFATSKNLRNSYCCYNLCSWMGFGTDVCVRDETVFSARIYFIQEQADH